MKPLIGNESRLFGFDTRSRNAVASSALLDALTPFFEQGTFGPPAVDRVFPLTYGVKAYEEVGRGQVRGRLLLSPETRFSLAGLQEWRGGRSLSSIRTIVVALLILLMWSAVSLAQTPQPMPPGPPQNPLRPELGPIDQSDENFSLPQESRRPD